MATEDMEVEARRRQDTMVIVNKALGVTTTDTSSEKGWGIMEARGATEVMAQSTIMVNRSVSPSAAHP